MNQMPQATVMEDRRWALLKSREPEAVGQFVYAVKTTGIFCLPTCSAKLPKPENVIFFNGVQEAEDAGFRACLRCRPKDGSLQKKQADLVTQACRLLEESDANLGLNQLAEQMGLSPYHFHRIFKAATGLTPKAYARGKRQERLQQALERETSVTTAVYESGFESSSGFYVEAERSLGMSPGKFKKGGVGEVLHFSVGPSRLGLVLVAKSQKGLCAIFLGEDSAQLEQQLREKFPKAEVRPAGADFEETLAQVIAFVEKPGKELGLPLDIRGTVFQQRVWQALGQIPLGSTKTYTEVAKQLGQPNSVRAVASACAANALAVAIPCHRVLRQDGSLAGYRWGVERKKELLSREQTDEIDLV